MTYSMHESNSDPIVYRAEDGEMVTDSRIVAEIFGKRHRDVLRAIKNLETSNEFKGRNFARTVFIDKNGDEQIEYTITRDGFTFLAMGFTGAKAAQFKEAFIAAFNQLEQQQALNLDDPSTLRNLLVNYTGKVMALESEIEENRPRLEAHARIAEADGSFCITDAAKTLQVRPKDLFQFLSNNGWIYKRPGNAHWTAYQAKLTQGLLEHKTTTVHRGDGSEKITEQVRVTAKGLTSLAKRLPPAAELVA